MVQLVSRARWRSGSLSQSGFKSRHKLLKMKIRGGVSPPGRVFLDFLGPFCEILSSIFHNKEYIRYMTKIISYLPSYKLCLYCQDRLLVFLRKEPEGIQGVTISRLIQKTFYSFAVVLL
jgi:hypothetical protein